MLMVEKIRKALYASKIVSYAQGISYFIMKLTYHVKDILIVLEQNISQTYLFQLSILGFMLLRQAAEAFGWKLNYGGIALMWRGGCIIRSAFLGKIKAAFDSDPDLVSTSS